jgi:hypothetical protein
VTLACECRLKHFFVVAVKRSQNNFIMMNVMKHLQAMQVHNAYLTMQSLQILGYR